MASERNALTELAERLDAIMPYVTVGCEVCAVDKHLTSTRAKAYIVAARRIVAKLAQVKLNGVGWPVRLELADAYEVCRAIAGKEAE